MSATTSTRPVPWWRRLQPVYHRPKACPLPTPSAFGCSAGTAPDTGGRRGRARPPYFLILCCLILSIPLVVQAEERWKIQFNYDKVDSSLNIRDLQCPSPQRCIAAGVIFEKNGHGKGTAVITSDGGKQWSLLDLKEQPISLFFLNDSLGWMVTDRGVWATDESGRSWKKLEGLKKGIVRVHFLDRLHGYAIGFPKTALETKDGGKTWTDLTQAKNPETNAENTLYECITFSGNHGLIAGRVIPPAARNPLWMEPEMARFHRERQATVIMLETFDGGKTWASSTSALFGHLTQVRLAQNGFAVMLFEHEEYHSLPSNVFAVAYQTNLATNIFGEADRAVRDVMLLPDGGAILAAVEPPGKSNQVPIPGKLKMLRSNNLKVWLEMDVDYRAVGQRAILAAPDARHIWVATDTGMILHLVDTGNPPK